MTIDQRINVLATITLFELIDYQLLPYHRFGENKYGFLGRAYDLEDFTPPAPETLHRLRAIIDEAFGRKSGELSRPEGVP